MVKAGTWNEARQLVHRAINETGVQHRIGRDMARDLSTNILRELVGGGYLADPEHRREDLEDAPFNVDSVLALRRWFRSQVEGPLEGVHLRYFLLAWAKFWIMGEEPNDLDLMDQRRDELKDALHGLQQLLRDTAGSPTRDEFLHPEHEIVEEDAGD